MSSKLTFLPDVYLHFRIFGRWCRTVSVIVILRIRHSSFALPDESLHLRTRGAVVLNIPESVIPRSYFCSFHPPSLFPPPLHPRCSPVLYPRCCPHTVFVSFPDVDSSCALVLNYIIIKSSLLDANLFYSISPLRYSMLPVLVLIESNLR